MFIVKRNQTPKNLQQQALSTQNCYAPQRNCFISVFFLGFLNIRKHQCLHKLNHMIGTVADCHFPKILYDLLQVSLPLSHQEMLVLHPLKSAQAFRWLHSEYSCHNVMLVLRTALHWPGNLPFLLLGSWPPCKKRNYPEMAILRGSPRRPGK